METKKCLDCQCWGENKAIPYAYSQAIRCHKKREIVFADGPVCEHFEPMPPKSTSLTID